MKCPYIMAKCTTVTQTQEDETVELVIQVMAECFEEKCAVWHDGVCCYNGRPD